MRLAKGVAVFYFIVALVATVAMFFQAFEPGWTVAAWAVAFLWWTTYERKAASR